MPSRHDRREFLRQVSLGTAGAALGTGALAGLLTSAGAAQERPNFVFLLVDDLRFDAMGFMGHPQWLRTPNIDRLRRMGTHFTNAFVVHSLCAPSRCANLSGMYGHSNGVRDNMGHDPYPEVRTYPMALQEAGYNTAFVGKWHMANTNIPRPGFDYWLSFVGQGVYENPTLNENGREFKAEGYMTDLLTDYGVRFLQQSRTRPFSLCLWHKAVHGPFTPAERHRGLYPDAEYPAPDSLQDDLAGKPHWQRAVQSNPQSPDVYGKPAPDKLPPATWDPKAKGRLDYYRTLAAVDDSVGEVLDTLEKTGQLENTVILFAGDNGFFFGEHRRGDKRLMYEESLRIPFLMSYPRMIKPGSTIDEMVLNIDVAPTLLDLAGVPAAPQMQGRSMKPLFTGEKTTWRTSFLYEYFQDGSFAIPPMVGVRTERWKYVTYPTLKDLDELYDLEHDPQEMHNLALDPACAAQLATMKAEMERLKKETNYTEAPPPPPRPKVTGPATLALHYSFDHDTATEARDDSGMGNAGKLTGTELAGGKQGDARRFSGQDSIDVPKSKSVSPADRPFSVELWAKAFEGNGVLISHGGKSNGYVLYLEAGVPHFGVRLPDGLYEIAAPKAIGDDWVHLAAVMTGTAEIKLYVNGKEVASREVPQFIAQDPNETLCLGMDRGSLVGGYGSENGFVGMIDELKIYGGALQPAAIEAAAKA